MPYVTYDNIRALISTGNEQSLSTGNYKVLYATNFTANNTAQLKRVKRIGQELDYYIQTGPKSSSVSVSVIPVTGVGINQFADFFSLTGDFVSGSYIQVPSYRFDKCFLKSISINIEPWKVISANLDFDSYGLATGSGIYSFSAEDATLQVVNELIPLSFRETTISFSTLNSQQQIKEYESINFSLDVERLTNYEIGSEYPAKASVGKITKSLQINGISNIDWLSDFEPKHSVTATITIANGYSFSVAGILNAQTLSIDGNGVAKGGLQIVEEMV
jgi:hypothetical protein